jgi:CBS domain-containing protein
LQSSAVADASKSGVFVMLAARDIMTDELTTIRPDAPIEDAIDLLLDQQISGLPVTDENGHLVGIITEFALLAMVYDHQVKNHTVEQHMTRELITVNADDPISRVADLCIVHRVRRLPVMKNGRLVGLIARRDVLKALRGCPTACMA